MSAVSLSKLTKVYSTGVAALSGLDLEVADGEFVVLVGPSGCGKTTALRMVAGLETITSGTISFGGRVVNGVSPRQRDVAMVFQNYALYPHLTVAENMSFALANRGVPRAERARRVRSAASILGLLELLNRKPAQLSGGQRQRVAMGRALVREPSVFLMDEPLSNLDAKLRVQMRAEILRVHKEIGAATLYVTHDQVEAMTMGDRVAVLHAGVLQQYGAPRSLYDRPANLFVASFIGSPAMNLYEASVSGGELVLGSQRVFVGAVEPALARYRERKVIVGVRPEDLVLGGGGVAGGAVISAEVRLVEMLGSELHVFFKVDAPTVAGGAVSADPGGLAAGGGGSDPGGPAAGGAVSADPGDPAGAELLAGDTHNGVARLDPRSAVRAGQRVTFLIDPERLRFFDPDTGAAIR